MSKLLGSGPLVLESQFKVTGKPGPSPYPTRKYICRRCSVEFMYYKGVRQIAPGIGLCKLHNPTYQDEQPV